MRVEPGNKLPPVLESVMKITLNIPNVRNMTAILLTLSTVISPPVHANGALREACRADYRNFCASVQPGGGRIIECLKQHETELSPGCLASLGSVAECREQAKKICASENQDAAALRACIKTHASEFSPECRQALNTR